MALTSPTVGLAAVMASILIPVAQVCAPLAQQMYISSEQNAVNKSIEMDKHKEQVAHLLIDTYIGHPPKEQLAALVIIEGLFNEYIGTIKEGLAGLAADSTVTTTLDIAVAKVDNVPASDLKIATDAEQAGFYALTKGDLRTAKEQFQAAYAAYPTFHNVDEINTVLKVVKPDDEHAWKEAINTIANKHTWGMSEANKKGLYQQIKAR